MYETSGLPFYRGSHLNMWQAVGSTLLLPDKNLLRWVDCRVRPLLPGSGVLGRGAPIPHQVNFVIRVMLPLEDTLRPSPC